MPPKGAQGSWAVKKHFCEDCQHWITGTRDVIRNHMNTPQHKQKHERRIREQVADSRRARGVAVGDLSELGLKPTAAETKRLEKKAKQEEFLKRIQEELTKKKESDAALLARNKVVSYKDQMEHRDRKGKTWEIELDDDTGKACFVNQITGEKKFEVPFGLQLTEEEEEIWQEAQMVDWRQMPSIEGLNTKIGEWEEVPVEETFLNKYAAKHSYTPGTEDPESGEEEEDSRDSEGGPESVLYTKKPGEQMQKKYVEDQNDKFDQILEQSGGSISKAMDALFTQAKDKSRLLVDLAKRGIEVFDDEEEANPDMQKSMVAPNDSKITEPALQKPGLLTGSMFKKKSGKDESVKSKAFTMSLD